MHLHHFTPSDVLELGIRTEVRHSVSVTGPTAAPAPSKPTPVAEVKAAAADGKIEGSERTLFDKAPHADATTSERNRLRDAVTKAIGTGKPVRDKDGYVEVYDNGNAKREIDPMTLSPDGYSGLYAADVPVTEHERAVAHLGDSPKADSYIDQIAKIKASGSTTGIAQLERERDERLATEHKVADVVRDERALVGTLEGEKIQLQTNGSEDGVNDFQKLREEAQPLIDQFNANGGQLRHSGWWQFENWNETQTNFDDLAKMFREHPDDLKDFEKVQGKLDWDGGDTRESMEKHIASIAEKDPELAGKIAQRYDAAVGLHKIMDRYLVANGASDGSSNRVKQIEAEQKDLNTRIEAASKVLSKTTLDEIEAKPYRSEADTKVTDTARDEALARQHATQRDEPAQPADAYMNLPPADAPGGPEPMPFLPGGSDPVDPDRPYIDPPVDVPSPVDEPGVPSGGPTQDPAAVAAAQQQRDQIMAMLEQVKQMQAQVDAYTSAVSQTGPYGQMVAPSMGAGYVQSPYVYGGGGFTQPGYDSHGYPTSGAYAQPGYDSYGYPVYSDVPAGPYGASAGYSAYAQPSGYAAG